MRRRPLLHRAAIERAQHPRSDRRGCTHAGFTLVEMVVVFSLLAAFLTVAIVLLGLLLRTDTAGHDAVADQLAVARLSRQFRADAHAAASVAAAAESPRVLEMKLADGRLVAWSAGGGDVRRTVQHDGRTVSRETYRIIDGATAFSVAPEAGWTALTVQRPRRRPVEGGAGDVGGAMDELRIQAAVGIDLAQSSVVTEAPAAASGEAR